MKSHNPLLKKLEVAFEKNDFHPRLISKQYRPDGFGNAVVKFQYRNLLLSFVRDRSFEEVNISHVDDSRKEFWAYDIEIALGLKSAEQVVGSGLVQDVPAQTIARGLKEPIADAIVLVKLHGQAIEKAFADSISVLEEGRWRRCAAQWGPDISAFPPEDQERMRPYLKPQ